MNDGWDKSVEEDRDLKVLISNVLKFPKQCLMAKNKVNLMLAISRGVSYKSAEVMSKSYRYVRPYLEYCIQFWEPINAKDADVREGPEKSN